MTSPNPYAAPAARSPARGDASAAYVPLGWRTTMATLSVIGLTVSSLALHAMQASFGERAKDPRELAIVLTYGLAGLGLLVTQISSIVFVLVWIHRASQNLRGLGRYGMRSTPGACVVAFFIPIASIWLPFSAMREIWRASDPEATQATWFSSKSTPLVGIWWVAWVVAGLIDLSSLPVRDAPSTEGALGLVADLPRVLATVALVILMRALEERQERAAVTSGLEGVRIGRS